MRSLVCNRVIDGSEIFGPIGQRRLEVNTFAAERMRERNSPGMQTKRRIGERQSLLGTNLLIRQIKRIADNRQIEMPEMQADLVRATGDGTSLNQRRAIFEPSERAEFC